MTLREKVADVRTAVRLWLRWRRVIRFRRHKVRRFGR